MKHLYLSLSFLLSSLSVIGQNPGDDLFDDSYLHEIRFEMADTNLFITTKDYQRLKMTIDGNLVDSVGFKRKGNISAYTNPEKHGIKIKTNRYVGGKRYDGIREFTLHMNYQDPTMMREKLTYDLCRDMGLFSLRTAFARVYINNDYWGLYTIVEGKDEMYKQVFDHRDMDAIESLDFGTMCFISNNPDDYDVDNNGGNPTYQLENGDGITAWPGFANMIDKANNTSSAEYLDTVSQYLNLEDFFKYQALNVYLMNIDSYIELRGNQIYVYDTTAKLWQVTPWDFNASFGLWNNSVNMPSTFPMIPGTISSGCIAGEMNNVSELRTYYLDAMCLLNSIVGDTVDFFNKIDTWKNQIQQAVYDDTRNHINNSDFDNGTEYGFHMLFGENQPALKTFVAQRLAVITQGLAGLNYDCGTIGIEENEKNNLLKIFPNPASDLISIDLSDGNYGSLNLSIVNSVGQIVEVVNNFEDGQIDISNLDPGLYFVINQEIQGRRLVGKFIKE